MAGIVKNGREKTDLFAASHLVCFFKTGSSGLSVPCLFQLLPARLVDRRYHDVFPTDDSRCHS